MRLRLSPAINTGKRVVINDRISVIQRPQRIHAPFSVCAWEHVSGTQCGWYTFAECATLNEARAQIARELNGEKITAIVVDL